MNLKSKEKKWKKFFFYFFREVFIIEGITFLILLIMEDSKKGLVSNYLDLKVFLIIVAVSGIISLLGSNYLSLNRY